jgi:hypothetical protein
MSGNPCFEVGIPAVVADDSVAVLAAFSLGAVGLIYAFVGIQMGWVLRPFIGQPGVPTTFFRPGAWGNAYVELWEKAGDVVKGRRRWEELSAPPR